MQKEGVRPDVVTCCSLISALESGGQWMYAEQLFEQMCHAPSRNGQPALANYLQYKAELLPQQASKLAFAAACSHSHTLHQFVLVVRSQKKGPALWVVHTVPANSSLEIGF